MIMAGLLNDLRVDLRRWISALMFSMRCVICVLSVCLSVCDAGCDCFNLIKGGSVSSGVGT